MNSQMRFQRMCTTLANNKVSMVSSKFMEHSIPFITLRKIDVVSKSPPILNTFFDIAGQLIFLKIQSHNEGKQKETQFKKLSSHSRKGHHQHKRERSKDKLFSFIEKGKTSN